MISHRQIFLNHVAQTSPKPIGLEIVRANGVYLTDINNKRYMDMIAGISVSALGHGNSDVKRAVQKQMRKYAHLMVYGEFVQHPQAKLAKWLIAQLPQTLDSVFYTNSGSEAVEGAIKLAKRATGRPEIISCHNAYHGSTQGALSIMGSEWLKNMYRPLVPGNRLIHYNRLADLEKISNTTAAVIIEPVAAEAGAIAGDVAYFKALRKKCNEKGCLLIFDEIQTGVGRTGSLYAFQQMEVVPDIFTTAKAFGAGLPLGAFIASKQIMKNLAENPILGHMNTFGGNAVCCAAALAGLKVLKNGSFMQAVAEKHALIKEGLQHDLIEKITGKGLLIAVHFKDEATNFKVIENCIKNGIVTDWFLFNSSALRICPPLIITNEQLKKGCRKILLAIDNAMS